MAVVIGAMLAAGLVACGGSSGSATAEGSKTSTGGSEGGSSAPSQEFMAKGGKNNFAKFGEVASDEEREAASSVLEENLQARAAGEWTVQCASLTAAAIKGVKGKVPPAEAKSCAKALETYAEPASATKSVRANTMTGPIDVLRVSGEKGYALYHGTKGVDYAMPMAIEDGEWKVGSLITTAIP